METPKKKLQGLISGKSSWKEDAEWRQKNDYWIETSQQIAIKILIELRNQKLSQKALAEKLGVTPQQVNKIVKGLENLTIETIKKLELVLGITLITVVNSDVELQGQTAKSQSEVQQSKIHEWLKANMKTVLVSAVQGENNDYAMAA